MFFVLLLFCVSLSGCTFFSAINPVRMPHKQSTINFSDRYIPAENYVLMKKMYTAQERDQEMSHEVFKYPLDEDLKVYEKKPEYVDNKGYKPGHGSGLGSIIGPMFNKVLYW